MDVTARIFHFCEIWDTSLILYKYFYYYVCLKEGMRLIMNTLIIAGGEIDKQILENYIKEHSSLNIIAVDKGLEALFKLNVVPNHVVGDFDSVDTGILQSFKNNPKIVFHKYNPEKDNTDTDIALNLAIELDSSNVTIIGALGKRMDHSLANIHILKNSLEAGIPCQILDSYNRIYLVNSNTSIYKNKVYGKYVSLIPLSTKIDGLTLNGFKYPLQNYSLSIGTSLGVSNEIVENVANIELKSGILIVIESKDE